MKKLLLLILLFLAVKANAQITPNYGIVYVKKGATGSGNNSLYAGVIATHKDLAGNPRQKVTNIDMSAYESNTNTSPTITTITSSTANGTYKIGDPISVQVNFSEAVNVTGNPTLILETGAIDRAISYTSGSGSSTLTFNYTVQAGDVSADLDYTSTTALDLNGSTIRNAVGNNANLTLANPGAVNSLGNNKALIIDGIVPTVASIVVSGSPSSYATSVDFKVTFSEPVINVSIGDFSIYTTAGAIFNSISILGSGAIYTFTLNGITGSGTVKLILNSSTNITDLAGNASPVAYTNGSTHIVAANKTPVIGNLNGDSLAWPGAGNLVILDAGGNATITDAELDASNWGGASLNVQRTNTPIASDIFGFNTAGYSVSGGNLQTGGSTTFATYNNANGVLAISFNANATKTLVQDVIRSIKYKNDTPFGDATIRFTLSDGNSTATADVMVNSDFIYVTNATDDATINIADGVSFSEAVAIAAADVTGSQTIVFTGSTALTINNVAINESLTFDMDQANGISLNGGAINLGSGTTIIVKNGAGDSATIVSSIAGAGALSKVGLGELSFNGSNSFKGLTSVLDGELRLNGGSAIDNLGDVTVASGATLELETSETLGSLSGAGKILLGNSTLTSGGNNTNTTFSGAISGSGGLTKIGIGKFILSGTNTYGGASFIPGGTLAVNGALNGTSLVTVASGATLTGGGSVTKLLVSSGGTLSPGNSPGIFTVNGDLKMNSGSTLAIDINGTTAGNGYDQVNVLGTVDITGTNLTVTHGYTFGPNDNYTIINNDLTDAVTGNFNGLAEGSKITSIGNGAVLKASYLGTTGNDFTLSTAINNAPTITNVSPLNANVGATITITGSNFNTTAGNNVVFFGAVAAVATTATASSITVVVPTGATYGQISVLNTQNSLTGSGSQYFNPTFTPNKGAITVNDMKPKRDFTTGAAPRSVAIGDLDGDGKPDLAVINSVAATVSVFRNTSTSGSISASSFTAKQDFTTGSRPYSVAIGDLDGDGKPDLAVTNFSSNTVSVFRNTSISGSLGASSFTTKRDFTTGTAPQSVAIGDIDGDGKPDLAVANSASNTVSLFRNTSTSGSLSTNSFTAKQDFTTGSFPRSVAIGDIDGDGKPDLAVANYGSRTVSVFRNTSTSGSINASSFTAKQDFTTGTAPQSVAIGDIDGDGKPDLAVANGASNTVSLFGNTSTSGSLSASSFTTKQDFATGASPISVTIGDIDGDDKPDLAVANYASNMVSVFRNTSTSGILSASSFTSKQDFTTGKNPYSVTIGDLDGDGKPDLVVVNYDGNTFSVLRNTSINADLSALMLSNGTLSPSFASGTIVYTATVSNSTTSIILTPTTADANASLQVQVNNGGYATVASGSASGALALNVGSNTIDVKVTAEDPNAIKIYTVTVTRAKANQTIAFPNFSAKNTTSPDFEPGATTDSGLALTYTSSNTSVATVYQDNTDGGKWKIHIQGEGTTDIVAAQADNSNYNSASVSRQLIVGNVLPVELTNYEAKIQNNKEVLLSWVTSSELNNAGFEIWKPTDGKAFEKLTFVKGVGSGATNQRYSYVDLSPNTGDNYYKLIQLDKDGVGKEIGLKSVRFEISKQDIVSIYPNPTSNFVNIDFDASKFTSISVSDVSGKVILKRKISSTESKVSLNVEKLPTASYIIKLRGAKGSVAKTFIKL